VATPRGAIEIRDRPACAGGIVLARATDATVRRARFGIVGDDALDLQVPASSPVASWLTSRSIVRVEFGNTVHEWRLLDDEAVVSEAGGVITAKAVSLLHDLASAGKIRTTDPTTGLPTFRFSVEATPTELVDDFLIAGLAAEGYGYIARGTIEPTTSRLWQWNLLNRLELLSLLCSETGCEMRLRQTATQYLIDVVEIVNGDLDPVEVRPGLNLRRFTRTRKGATHCTVLAPFGAALPDGANATIARNCWKVTAVDTGANRVTLGDPAGTGTGPIVEDDQYVATAGLPAHYLFRYGEGGLDQIVDSFVATQQVQLPAGAAATYQVGDLVEIRAGAGATGLAVEIPDGWLTTTAWAARRVTNVDGGANRLTVDDPWTPANAPVGFDGRYRGWTVRPYFRSASSAMSANVAASNPDHRQITVASTTGMQAGDLAYVSTNNPSGAPPWTLSYGAALEVVSVDSATLVTVKHRRKTGAVPLLSNPVLSTWRARSDRRCLASNATNGTLDVNSVTSIVVGDVVELVRQYDGPLMTLLSSPAGVALHGRAYGTFERDTRGERNLLRNPLFRDWTAGANALPDHWHGVSRTFGLQNTDPEFLDTGLKSVRLTAETIASLTSAIGAGATSAQINVSAGHVFEVGESVRLSAGGGSEEVVVLTSVTPGFPTVIGFPATTNAHANGAAVRPVMTPALPALLGSQLSGHMRLVSTAIDVPTHGILDTFHVRVPFLARGFGANDQVLVRVTVGAPEGSPTDGHQELGGTYQTQTQTLTVGTDIDADVVNVASILITQPIPGGRLLVEIAANLSVNSANNTKQLYVCAVGLAQAAYDPGAIAEWSFATALHQAANAALALRARAAPASYEFDVADLYGLDPLQWPDLQFLAGRTARTTEPAAGVSAEALRIIGLEVDYDRPAAVVAEVGTRSQRIAELLANARVPVPLVRVVVDPTTGQALTQVLVGASQQQVQLPGTGVVALPPDFGFFFG
jgi:hypothetical protein